MTNYSFDFQRHLTFHRNCMGLIVDRLRRGDGQLESERSTIYVDSFTERYQATIFS